MAETETQPVESTIPVEGGVSTESADAPSDSDNLENLLEQYDSDQPSEIAESTETDVTETPQTGAADTRARNEDGLTFHEALAEHNYAENKNREDAEDLQAVMSEVQSAIDDTGRIMVDGFGRMWIHDRYESNAELKEAWDHRYDSDEAVTHFEKVFAKNMQALHREIQAMPDQQATEDRDAVAAAVLGSAKTPPPKAPVDYTNMNDAEFKKSVKEEYGFDAFARS